MSRLPVIALATWRVSYMLVHERGPFAIFKGLRDSQLVPDAEYIKADPNHQAIPVTLTELGQLLACVWCLSVWVAPLLMVVDRFAPRLIDALAISAGAIWVNKGVGG